MIRQGDKIEADKSKSSVKRCERPQALTGAHTNVNYLH